MYIQRINNNSWYDGIYHFKDLNCSIIHRENGPAIEYDNGIKEWLFNGVLHRENGPTFECPNGNKKWYFNGKLHREDGPAIEYANGNKYYFLNNKKLLKKEYIEYIKSKPLCPAKKTKILKKCT